MFSWLMIQMSFLSCQQLLFARGQRMSNAANLLTAIKPISAVQAFPRDEKGSQPGKMNMSNEFVYLSACYTIYVWILHDNT